MNEWKLKTESWKCLHAKFWPKYALIAFSIASSNKRLTILIRGFFFLKKYNSLYVNGLASSMQANFRNTQYMSLIFQDDNNDRGDWTFPKWFEIQATNRVWNAKLYQWTRRRQCTQYLCVPLRPGKAIFDAGKARLFNRKWVWNTACVCRNSIRPIRATF